MINEGILDNDFRYLVLTNESEEDAKKLNEFLEENNYEYGETKDALQIYAEELYVTAEIHDHMAKAMIRLPKDARLTNDYAVDIIADNISNYESCAVNNSFEDLERCIKNKEDAENDI